MRLVSVSRPASRTPDGCLSGFDSGAQSFYGGSLVTWTPAPAAAAYDVQWSRAGARGRPPVSMQTFSTSAVLPLKPGTWWYRVRGINPRCPATSR